MSLRNLPSLLAASILSGISLACAEDEPSRFRLLPQSPRISLQTNINHRLLHNFEADGFLPLWRQPNHLFFTSLQARYNGNHAGFVGLGVGLRYQLNPANLIWAAHCFIEHTWPTQGQGFSLISPGVQVGNRYLSLGLNGYLPINKKQRLAALGWDNQPESIHFKGHQQYNYRYDAITATGPGFDILLSKHFHHFGRRLTLSGGAYYFKLPVHRIWGLTTGFAYPISPNLHLRVTATYDNMQRYTAELGLRIQFGNQDHSRRIYQDHLEGTPQRHLVSRAHGTALPIVQYQEKRQHPEVQVDNIWFFSDQASSNTDSIDASNCTAERICSIQQVITQNLEKIATISPNANLYVTGKQAFSSAADTPIALQPGQSLLGRSTDFKDAADLQNLPLFHAAFNLKGHNYEVESIQIENTQSNPFTTAIAIEDVHQVKIKRVNIVMKHDALDRESLTAISIKNSKHITVEDSRLSTEYNQAYGDTPHEVIYIYNGQNIQMSQNKINNQLLSSTPSLRHIDDYYGIRSKGNVTLQLYDNTILVQAKDGSNAGALAADNGTDIQAKSNQFFIQTDRGDAIGILFEGQPAPVSLQGNNHFTLRANQANSIMPLGQVDSDSLSGNSVLDPTQATYFKQTETDIFRKE